MSAAGTLNFTVTVDTAHEGDETLELSGSAPGLMVTGAEVTIRDDDTAPTSISLSVTASPIAEGGGGVSLPVQATLLGGGTRAEDTTVALRLVDMTATVTDDYTTVWGTTSLTIPAGEFSASTTLTITPVQDTFHEGTESIAVRGLNTDPGLPVNGVRLNIQDDDPAPAQVRLEVDPGSISESSGSVLADVHAILVGDSTLTTDTRITTNLVSSDPLSRVAGGSLLLPLEIDAGESSGKSILVLLNLNDYVDDPDELLELRGTASNPDLVVLPGQVVIQDDDTAGVTVSPTSLNVQEGQARRYTVNLDSEPTADVTVTVDVPAGAGFTVSPGTLTFTSQNWSNVQRVTVTALEDPDARDEPTATITHSVSSTDTLYDGFSTDSVAVIVTDDDTDGVTITPTELTVTEGGTSTYTAVLDTQPTGTVTITVNDPTDNADVTAEPASLTFTTDNWSTAQTVTVTASQDQDNQDETATVKHSVSGYGSVTASDVDITLEDDAPESLIVSFGSATYSVDESDDAGTTDVTENEVEITVTLSADPERTVTVPIAATDQDGASSDDYSGVPSSVEFTSGETEKSFTFSATSDTVDDDGESVKLTFGTLPTGVSAGATDEAVVSITDDDVPGVTVEPTQLNVLEGATSTYTIRLNTEPTDDVTVTVITPSSSRDVEVSTTTLSFTTVDWATPQTVIVEAGKNSYTADEIHTIEHTVTGGDYSNGVKVSSVEVTVEDIDPEMVYSLLEPQEVAEDAGSVRIGITAVTAEAGAPIQEYFVAAVSEQGTAKWVLDFLPVSLDVLFPLDGFEQFVDDLGQTRYRQTVYFDVRIVDDHRPEQTESFTIRLQHSVTYDGTYDVGEVTVTITDNDVIGVTVDPTSLPVIEGEVSTYTIRLNTEPTADVTVSINDPSNTDVTADPASLTFSTTTWDVAQTVTVAALDDDDRVNDSGTVTHSSSGGDYGSVDIEDVEVTVIDDTPVFVSFAASTYEVLEDAATTITVILSADPEGTVTVPVTAANQDGASTSDYSGVPGSVTFSPGETEKSFTFSAASDNDNDDGESVVLGFGSTLPDGFAEGSPAETTVSIVDDDPAMVFSLPEPQEVAENAGTLTIGATAMTAEDGIPNQSYYVLFDAERGTAGPPDDYVAISEILGFPSDEFEEFVDDQGQSRYRQTVYFDVGIVDDFRAEQTESFNLYLSDFIGYSNSTNLTQEVTVTITDDDVIGVTVDPTALPLREGTSSTYTVRLDTQPTDNVTITVTDPSNTDVTADPASLTFSTTTWDIAQTVTVTALDDDDVANDSGTVTHSSSGGDYDSVDIDDVVVTVIDDPSVSVSFGQDSYTVAEGSSVAVKVKLDEDPERTVTIPVTKTGQDGASTDDYSGVPTGVTFNSGDTEKSITFAATHDSVDDDGESVKLTFGALPTGVSAGSTDEAVVNITDDDLPSVEVSFEQDSYTVAEGSSVAVKVKLDEDPERTVTIPVTKTGQDGASTDDYSGVPTGVTFNSGDTEKSITFAATHDSVDDDGESVKLTFGALPTGVSAGSTDEAVVNITDDDLPTVTVQFEASSYSVTEGGNVEVTVTLSEAPERSVTIPLSKTNQGGSSDSDYSGVPSSVTFNNSDREKSFTIEATQDNLEDSGESVKLTFGTMPTGVSAGTNDEASVSITNVSAQNSLTVNFGASGYGMTEGDTAVVKVTLSTVPGSEVTIPLTKVEQGGASSADYSGVPAGLTFGSSDTEKTFTFSSTEDTIDDDGESVKLGFGMLPDGITAGSTSETTVDIIDDDAPATVTVSFEQGTYTVAEGGSVAVKVKLDEDPERTVTIPITKAGQGGATSADYSGVPTGVTFNSGDTEKTITFAAAQDDANDDGESVKLTFGALPTGVSAGSTDEAVVNITDDDLPSVEVSFEQGLLHGGGGGQRRREGQAGRGPRTHRHHSHHQGGPGRGLDQMRTIPGVPTGVTFNSGDTEKTHHLRRGPGRAPTTTGRASSSPSAPCRRACPPAPPTRPW